MMNEAESAALLLDSAEIAAILDLLVPDGAGSSVEYILPGVSSLLERGLVTIQGDMAHFAPQLAAVIEPIMTRTKSLTVARLADAQAEEYLFSGERAVRRTTAGGGSDEFQPIAVKETPAVIAASLGAQAAAALREPAIPEIGELSQFADFLGAKDVPHPHSAAGLVFSRPGGQERIITVLLHDGGFTWVEGKERPRVAFVETQEELAELVANLIGAGVK
jgi:hypothetical protein